MLILDPLQGQFVACVSAVSKEVPLVQAVYAALDSINASYASNYGIQIACHKGCGLCCEQMVYCLPQEWQAIRQQVLGMKGKQRFDLEKRMKKSHRDWVNYGKTHAVRTWQKEGILRLYKDWVGKRCPFLNDQNECDVYENRPVACRCAFHTGTECKSHEEMSTMPIPAWANWSLDILTDALGDRSAAFLIPIPALVGYIEQDAFSLFRFLSPTFSGKRA